MEAPSFNKDPAPQLWVELQSKLREFIRRRVPQESDTEDLLQEVFMRMYRDIETLSTKAHAPAWLFRVAANAIADHYRDQAQRTVILDQDDIGPAQPETGAAARAEIARCLEPLLARIPEPYQEAVRRVDYQGQSQVDAATELGISIPAMKSRVQRGRAKLMKLLTDCCHLELDRRGQVLDYAPRDASCSPCDPSDDCSIPTPNKNRNSNP
ncbi:MAG TPA: RNA polymerase sigma factor SigZ [Planctomycetota bacterium]|jgi:RNA polymerase sigma-70 factor (ECF subfamily)|nr:RNA polymerase sigma factor SigZ [Planctomycetota bacterium]